MVREILRRPSIAVGMWIVLVLGLFAWRGDLSLDEGGRTETTIASRTESPQTASPKAASKPSKEPVVLRRKQAPPAPMLATRNGRVFDSMGFLLVGAEVIATEGASRRTDAEGTFALDLNVDRAADLLVRAEGRRSQWRRTSAHSPDPLLVRMEPAAPWDSQPRPPEPALPLRGEGSVMGLNGEPVPFAFVNVLGTDCWGKADDIGRVSLPLPSRRSTFVVHRPATGGEGGVAAVSKPFVASRERGVVPLPGLVGGHSGAIHGIVRDERAQGVVGLPVEVRSVHGRRFVETGPGGSFELSGLLPGEYEVEPFAYRGAVGAAVTVRIDREVVSCDLHVTRLEESNVRVVDEAGAAVAGVWVASSMHGMRRGIGQVNSEGLISLPVAANSEFEVRRDGNFANCEVRKFDPDAQPATLVIAAP